MASMKARFQRREDGWSSGVKVKEKGEVSRSNFSSPYILQLIVVGKQGDGDQKYTSEIT